MHNISVRDCFESYSFSDHLDTVGVVGSIPIARTNSSLLINALQRKLKVTSQVYNSFITPYYATIRLCCDGKFAGRRRVEFSFPCCPTCMGFPCSCDREFA